MLHPSTEIRWLGGPCGVGVVATAPLPCGTLIWVRDPLDQVLDAEAIAGLGSELKGRIDRYTFLEGGEWVLGWDHAKYVNHSCVPNCIGLDAGIDLAVRDIEVGEQITNDYGLLGPKDPFPCACGEKTCRGVVREGVPRAIRADLERAYLAALERVGSVEQPLWPLLSSPLTAGQECVRKRGSDGL